MAISHFPTISLHSAAPPSFPVQPHASILHRRSRAEKDESSDEGDSDDDLDFHEALDSSEDEDSLQQSRAANRARSKRVKLNSLTPLAFTATSLSPPFQPSSRRTYL